MRAGHRFRPGLSCDEVDRFGGGGGSTNGALLGDAIQDDANLGEHLLDDHGSVCLGSADALPADVRCQEWRYVDWTGLLCRGHLLSKERAGDVPSNLAHVVSSFKSSLCTRHLYWLGSSLDAPFSPSRPPSTSASLSPRS